LEFKWIIGGKWTPKFVHDTISSVKYYFYAGYIASGFDTYPAIAIKKFYGVIPEQSTWRMLSINIDYSEEMTNLGDGDFYPLIVKMTLDIESATQLREIDGKDDGVFAHFTNLAEFPNPVWY
jgi:hypothetical protein